MSTNTAGLTEADVERILAPRGWTRATTHGRSSSSEEWADAGDYSTEGHGPLEGGSFAMVLLACRSAEHPMDARAGMAEALARAGLAVRDSPEGYEFLEVRRRGNGRPGR
ncbi:hypothetical protein LN042_23115 [Kitasatospora sp. RB6PN24]|uniref:hypothetical protein n=1 Tax=Kitasatospora humi TaxID=2893891 RepID=UPI001E643144|nr:hypothetical protein [Kitasatospora humi]MCC9309927.1 hypothetical protein [Kitasatospora humi]